MFPPAHPIPTLTAVLATAALFIASPAFGRDCGADQFAQVVDQVGEDLRQANDKSEGKLERDFARLAKIKGWPAESATERGLSFLQDEQTRTLDQQASELLIRLDILSDAETKPATCERLDELKLATAQLLEVTGAKNAHISAKLAVALRPKLAPQPTAKAQPGKPATPAAQSGLKPSAFPKQDGPEKRPKVASQSPAAPARAQSRPRASGSANAWSTTTQTAPPPSAEVMAALPPVTVERQNLTFSSDEIRAAGRGLFGTISAELASVIKFAFDSYGKPNGYVLGTEGGAAFLAGLRYGHGQLVSKRFPPRKIYWQGPSIGTDFGITGSRVMMLVYNLDRPGAIYERFVGVEGAAYLVGGAGITFHKQGNIVLAPIRTGLGLRLGANVGYLKITPKRTFNPF